MFVYNKIIPCKTILNKPFICMFGKHSNFEKVKLYYHKQASTCPLKCLFKIDNFTDEKKRRATLVVILS